MFYVALVTSQGPEGHRTATCSIKVPVIGTTRQEAQPAATAARCECCRRGGGPVTPRPPRQTAERQLAEAEGHHGCPVASRDTYGWSTSGRRHRREVRGVTAARRATVPLTWSPSTGAGPWAAAGWVRWPGPAQGPGQGQGQHSLKDPRGRTDNQRTLARPLGRTPSSTGSARDTPGVSRADPVEERSKVPRASEQGRADGNSVERVGPSPRRSLP